MKQKARTLWDEARHPFRARMRPNGLRKIAGPRQVAKLRITAQDLREFLLAYCACFMAVSLYIA